MNSLSKFEELSTRYREVMDFALVYIDEAHSVESGDYDATSTNLQMYFASNIAEKMENAKELAKHTQLPIFVDKVDNAACQLYAAFPER